MKELLSRQFGPFNGATWLGVIAGGVGLGLLIRKRMGTTKAAQAAPSEAGTLVMTPSFPLDGDSQYNEGRLIDSVKAVFAPEFGKIWGAIESGKGSSAPTNPTQTAPPVTTDQPKTNAFSSWWHKLVNLGAIHGDPTYYATGRAAEYEYEHALKVADQNLRGMERTNFWKALVSTGLIQGDPAYYYEGKAAPYEYGHAYKVAAKALTSRSGAFPTGSVGD